MLPDLGNHLFDARLVRRPRPRDLRERPQTRQSPGGGQLVPKARGNFDLDFTSSRLIPEDARMSWPYRAVGKLFFTDDGSNFVCSASVMSKRVVVTAGHCVFSDGDFVSNIMFAPAFHEGQAPFGTWTSNFVATTDEWMADESVPNASDWGILVMDDQTFDGALRKIGDVTGWVGWILNKLAPNQVHILGYPGNIDRGQRMHQVTTGQSEDLAPNTSRWRIVEGREPQLHMVYVVVVRRHRNQRLPLVGGWLHGESLGAGAKRIRAVRRREFGRRCRPASW